MYISRVLSEKEGGGDEGVREGKPGCVLPLKRICFPLAKVVADVDKILHNICKF